MKLWKIYNLLSPEHENENNPHFLDLIKDGWEEGGKYFTHLDKIQAHIEGR